MYILLQVLLLLYFTILFILLLILLFIIIITIVDVVVVFFSVSRVWQTEYGITREQNNKLRNFLNKSLILNKTATDFFLYIYITPINSKHILSNLSAINLSTITSVGGSIKCNLLMPNQFFHDQFYLYLLY